jgi:uncharacterized membrane protein YbhN (UPF0104 family)
MVKPKLKIALKIGVSCLFVGYLSVKVDLTAIAAAVKDVDLSFYLLSTLIAVLSNFFIAGKYYILIKDSPINHSLLSLVKINFISRFYALFLPSAVGREFVRWMKVTRNQQGRSAFVASIIFERLTFLLVLILCGWLALRMVESKPEIIVLRQRLQPWLILALVIISALLFFYVSASVRSLAKSIIDRIFNRFSKRLNPGSFIESFSLNHMKAAFYAGTIGLSLVWQIFYISRLFTLINAAALPLHLMDIIWMGSLVLLLQTLPISFAGIGLREGAYAYLFTLYDLPAEKGVLIGLLFFSQMLIMAAVGGLFELKDP